jgi:hypothetical protein
MQLNVAEVNFKWTERQKKTDRHYWGSWNVSQETDNEIGVRWTFFSLKKGK